MIENDKAAIFLYSIDDLLAIDIRLDQTTGTHVQHMRAIGRNLVAGHQDHALWVKIGVVVGIGEDIVVGNHQKTVTAPGIIVYNSLVITLAIAGRRMRMQIANQPTATVQVAIGMLYHSPFLLCRSR
jgi:hypothetical protein